MGRRKKIVRPWTGPEVVAAVVVFVVGVALWRLLSWWIVALVVVPVLLVIAAKASPALRQHRRKLAPTLVGLGVAGMAFASKGVVELGVTAGWVWAVYAAFALAVGWAIRVEESADHRVLFTVCLVAALAWTGAVHWMSWSRWPDLAGAWLVAVIVASAFWWADRQVIAEVKVEEKVRSWPELVKGTDLAGTWRPEYSDKPEGGWRMRLSWRPGRKLIRSVQQQGALIESLMGAPRGSVSIEAGDDPNSVTVECSPTGALGALEWDGEPAVSIMQVIPMARYGDGTFEQYSRWVKGVGGKSKLRGGITRSGKSVAAAHDILTYGPAEDVVLWLIDLKGGASFRPMAPMADWFVSTHEAAVAMLEAGVRLCDARSHAMAEWGWDPWQPSREFPVIWIEIDETSQLLGENAAANIQMRALRAATTIAQQGAGLGILINVSTQYPTLGALGSSQFREQLTITECYRQRSEGTSGHFLPNAPVGVEPAHIKSTHKGAHFADIEGEFRPLVGQKFNVTAEHKQAVVSEYWETTPDIEECHWPVLGEAWAGRQQWAMVDGKVVRADATGVEMERDATADEDEDLAAHAATGAATTDELVSQAATVDLSHLRPAWADADDDGAPTFRELEAARLATLSPEERAAEKAAAVAALARMRETDPSRAPELVLELMRKVAPDPVSPGDAQKVTGLSERTVHRLLVAWESDGKVVHEGYGKYTLAAETAAR